MNTFYFYIVHFTAYNVQLNIFGITLDPIYAEFEK